MKTYPNICDIEDEVRETGDVERAINHLATIDYEIYKAEIRLAILKQDQKSVDDIVRNVQELQAQELYLDALECGLC